MDLYQAILLLLGACALIVFVGLIGFRNPQHLFVPVESLCTRRELLLWRSLNDVLQDEDNLVLCPKVRIGDLVNVTASGKKGFSLLMKVNKKHVDFVVAEMDTLKPVLAIELDDSSHQRWDRKKRDAFVDQVFASSGIPLLHVTTLRGFSQNAFVHMLKRVRYGANVRSMPVKKLPFGRLVLGRAQ